MKQAIVYSLEASLTAQWITLLTNFFGFFGTLSEFDEVLRSVLGIETFVQIVELIFYTWYSTHLSKVAEITYYRYHDWVITTPLMLFSTMVYYEYRNKPEEKVTIESFLQNHWKTVLAVFGFNLIMLGFGYAYERGLMSLVISTLLGFGGFAGSFYLIWKEFASKNPENYPLYNFMFIIWFLYGIAALFTPLWKNVSYNILDVFAKNFYGVFLSYLIYTKSLQQTSSEPKDTGITKKPEGIVE
jgi:bacteriorhodopsin